jgi:hypothetical protein
MKPNFLNRSDRQAARADWKNIRNAIFIGWTLELVTANEKREKHPAQLRRQWCIQMSGEDDACGNLFLTEAQAASHKNTLGLFKQLSA